MTVRPNTSCDSSPNAKRARTYATVGIQTSLSSAITAISRRWAVPIAPPNRSDTPYARSAPGTAMPPSNLIGSPTMSGR